jgi:hypothetical protein
MNATQSISKSSFRAATVVITIVVTLFAAVRTEASGRRRAVATSASPAALAISFVDASGSTNAPTLDAGAIRWHQGPGRGRSVTTRTIGIRIGAPSAESLGSATLRAYLEHHDFHQTIRVNGVALAASPQIVDRHTPIGVVTFHRIEIEVSRIAPAGMIASSIRWEVTTD